MASATTSTFVSDRCASCKTPNPKFWCSKCHAARYCDVACQKNHWPVHRPTCFGRAVVDLKALGTTMWEIVKCPRRMSEMAGRFGGPTFEIMPREFYGRYFDAATNRECWYVREIPKSESDRVAKFKGARDAFELVRLGESAAASRNPDRARKRSVQLFSERPPSAAEMDSYAVVAKCGPLSSALAMATRDMRRECAFALNGEFVAPVGVVAVPMPRDAPAMFDVYADPGEISDADWPIGKSGDYDALGNSRLHAVAVFENASSTDLTFVDPSAAQLVPPADRERLVPARVPYSTMPMSPKDVGATSRIESIKGPEFKVDWFVDEALCGEVIATYTLAVYEGLMSEYSPSRRRGAAAPAVVASGKKTTK